MTERIRPGGRRVEPDLAASESILKWANQAKSDVQGWKAINPFHKQNPDKYAAHHVSLMMAQLRPDKTTRATVQYANPKPKARWFQLDPAKAEQDAGPWRC